MGAHGVDVLLPTKTSQCIERLNLLGVQLEATQQWVNFVFT